MKLRQFEKKEWEITVEMTAIQTKTLLFMIGFPTSNNWRKMHGGVMDRRNGKRKKKCKFKSVRDKKKRRQRNNE